MFRVLYGDWFSCMRGAGGLTTSVGAAQVWHTTHDAETKVVVFHQGLLLANEKEIPRCGLPALSEFVSNDFFACSWLAAEQAVYIESGRSMPHFVWCRTEKMSLHTGFLLAMGRDRKERTDACV